MGWAALLAALIASFGVTHVAAPTIAVVAVSGVLGGLGIALGCFLVLRSLSVRWAGVAFLGVIMAIWTAVGLVVRTDAADIATQSCRVATAAQESRGDWSRISYRYQVVCPAGTYEIVDSPSKGLRAPRTVYAPGRRVTVSYDTTGRKKPHLGESTRPPVFVVLAGPAGAAVLTLATIFTTVTTATRAGRDTGLRRGRPTTPDARWGWALMAIGWLVLPAGVGVGGVVTAPVVVTLLVLLLGHLSLFAGCAVVAARRPAADRVGALTGDAAVLRRYLLAGLALAVIFSLGAYGGAEKLRLSLHGREYVCRLASQRVVPGTKPPLVVRGDFVLCPNGGYARMRRFTPKDHVGDLAKVTWDPERRRRATFSRDLEPVDVARALLRVPLVMIAAPLVPWILGFVFARRRRPHTLS